MDKDVGNQRAGRRTGAEANHPAGTMGKITAGSTQIAQLRPQKEIRPAIRIFQDLPTSGMQNNGFDLSNLPSIPPTLFCTFQNELEYFTLDLSLGVPC